MRIGDKAKWKVYKSILKYKIDGKLNLAKGNLQMEIFFQKNSKILKYKLILTPILLFSSMLTNATEGGGGTYDNGSENYMMGALPPSGNYYLMHDSFYQADTLRDHQGNKIPINFNLDAAAVITRLVKVTDYKLFGGQFAFQGILPLVHVDLDVAGLSQSKTGIGDFIFGPVLGYHLSPKLHYLVGFNATVPIGEYNKRDLVNIGRNYWSLEPFVGITYTQPKGVNADLQIFYDINAKNSDTDYQSGQEIHADYALGWGIGNAWTIGIGGYLYQQVTDDKKSGNTVENNKGRTYAIGPSIKYDAKKWFLTAKYENEFNVRNRAEGDSFKLKIVVPF